VENQLIVDIQAWIRNYNDAETASRREYYEVLCAQAPQTESLEVHMKNYGRFATTGVTATTEELKDLAGRLSMAIPDDLQLFYQTIGSLSSETIKVFSVSRLLENFNPSPSRPNAPRSIGIIDMIHRRWNGYRWELDPKNGFISQADIDTLNAAYTCVGWFLTEDEESATYIYFDRAGMFGTLGYHQDAIETLCDEDLPVMLKSSAFKLTLAQVFDEAFAAAAEILSEQESDE